MADLTKLNDDQQLGFLLGLQAAGAQLDLRFKARVKYNNDHAGKPDARLYNERELDGLREAYWTTRHLLGETTAGLYLRNRPVWQRFKDMNPKEDPK